MKMIEITNLNKYYSKTKDPFHALIDFNLVIKKGDFLVVSGPSGSGKSTLVNILGLLDVEFEGNYYFCNQNIKNLTDLQLSQIRNSKIGYVFQNFNLLFDQTVYENIELPLLYTKKSSKKTKEKVIYYAKKMGIIDKIDNRCFNLSGGQQQRVAIARALVNEPELLICDEPTGALDSKTSAEIIKIFKQLNKEGITVVLITHDSNIEKQFDTRIHILDGKCNEVL